MDSSAVSLLGVIAVGVAPIEQRLIAPAVAGSGADDQRRVCHPVNGGRHQLVELRIVHEH